MLNPIRLDNEKACSRFSGGLAESLAAILMTVSLTISGMATSALAAERDQARSEEPRVQVIMFGDATDSSVLGLFALVREVAAEYGEDIEVAWLPVWENDDKRGVAAAMALEAARMQGRFWAAFDDWLPLVLNGSLRASSAPEVPDEARFQSDRKDPLTYRRIERQAALRRTVYAGRSTHAVVINGRGIEFEGFDGRRWREVIEERFAQEFAKVPLDDARKGMLGRIRGLNSELFEAMFGPDALPGIVPDQPLPNPDYEGSAVRRAKFDLEHDAMSLPAAPRITGVVYVDYASSAARRLAANVEAVRSEREVADNTRIVVKALASDTGFSLLAATSVRCAQAVGGKGYGMHLWLLQQQRPNANAIEVAARGLGLDVDRFGRCLIQDGRESAPWIRETQLDAWSVAANHAAGALFIEGRFVHGIPGMRRLRRLLLAARAAIPTGEPGTIER